MSETEELKRKMVFLKNREVQNAQKKSQKLFKSMKFSFQTKPEVSQYHAQTARENTLVQGTTRKRAWSSNQQKITRIHNQNMHRATIDISLDLQGKNLSANGPIFIESEH
jgi:cell fate (sporulation/competence/biofilm development) regulator YmcA (YheA/YmcA/DUF963 family)